MRLVSLFMLILLSFHQVQARSFSDAELTRMLVPYTDSSFGGVWLDMDAVMEITGSSRLQAHEIQNLMRDSLESTTLGFSYTVQKPLALDTLRVAIRSILEEGQHPSGYHPVRFGKDEFAIVLDLDETLLVQWYEAGNGVDGVGSFQVAVRDSAAMSVDRKSGNSVKQPVLRLSAPRVILRPGLNRFFSSLSSLPGFAGFILFTAKEDRAAEDLVKIWKEREPQLFEHVLGLFSRNHLVFGGEIKKPSKDLRIFDETLKHVVLIDDNESRVLQKNLNHRVMKFGADHYIQAHNQGDKDGIALQEELLPFVAVRISRCVRNARIPRLKTSLSQCFGKNLGGLARSDEEEIRDYTQYMVKSGKIQAGSFSEGSALKQFHQPWVMDIEIPLTQPYPVFSLFVMKKE